MDSRNKRSDKNSELYRAITALDSLDDCYDFRRPVHTAGAEGHGAAL